jgi:hypothetical protein
MHLIETKVGEAARKTALDKPPFGPGFTEGEAVRGETLEVHGSDFSEPGDDYCEFRLLDAAGAVIGTRRVGGY